MLSGLGDLITHRGQDQPVGGLLRRAPLLLIVSGLALIAGGSALSAPSSGFAWKGGIRALGQVSSFSEAASVALDPSRCGLSRQMIS
jgi:hypothetical protein